MSGRAVHLANSKLPRANFKLPHANFKLPRANLILFRQFGLPRTDSELNCKLILLVDSREALLGKGLTTNLDRVLERLNY